MRRALPIVIAALTCVCAGCALDAPSSPASPRAAAPVQQAMVRVSVPETLELAAVLMATSEWGQGRGRRNFATDTDYYAAVQAQFGAYSEHAVFARLDEIDLDNFGDFIGLRENSVWYAFGDEGLSHVGPHAHWWNENSSPDHFGAALSLIEAFALEADFRAFYRSREGFYRSQIVEYRRMVDVADIITWLEDEFPLHYDSVDVFFSPLIQGNNSASSIRGDERNELRVVVPGPHLARRHSLAGGDVLLLRQTFTELDHGYVSPHSYRLRQDIGAAMSRPELWNAQGGSFYRSALSTFDEYLTWGLALLYVAERYDAQRSELARQDTVAYMRDSRGFVDFEAFHAELARLHGSRAEGVTIADQYPDMLNWIERRQEELAAQNPS